MRARSGHRTDEAAAPSVLLRLNQRKRMKMVLIFPLPTICRCKSHGGGREARDPLGSGRRRVVSERHRASGWRLADESAISGPLSVSAGEYLRFIIRGPSGDPFAQLN
ncbi:ferredoxin [Anopheles sinensis]|uniref:Ferredoxin n=1 Tax=Anopheles sinensis TaxID=74873 RepID=A0A084VVS7_ANOSI|nr:ferredoxin [Anopheles sinensis]